MCRHRQRVVLAGMALFIPFVAVAQEEEKAAEKPHPAMAAVTETFTKWDADKDGKISSEEWGRAPRTTRERLGRAGINTEREVEVKAAVENLFNQAKSRFDSYDRDKDGKMTPEEFARSTRTRGMMKDAGVDTSKEMDRDRFIESYVKVFSGMSVGSAGTTVRSTTGPRQRVTKDLPDAYREKDKNGDNQVGLYEWPRSDFATFFKLDRNNDGFLTPRELIRAEKLAASGTTSSSPITNGFSTRPSPRTDQSPSRFDRRSRVRTERGRPVPSPAPVGPSATRSTTRTVTPRTTPEPPADPNIVAAGRQFALLDKDKDGAISEEELARSRFTSKLFATTQTAISFPCKKDDFVALYVQARKKNDKQD